jgi:hypothetical protein
MKNHDLHKGRGPTIGGAILVGIIAACVVGMAKASEPAPSARAIHAQSTTQFTVSQYLSVETVTCVQYFEHADFQNYGTITGSICTSTAPLPIQSTATEGHVHVTFKFTDGSTFDVAGCRVDSTVIEPGFASVAINCV